MRVAMEAASLGLSSGGLARYTSELSSALARCFPQDEFLLLSDQPFSMPAEAPANLKRGGGPRTAAERRWWLWGLGREARRQQADLVHGPDFAVPYLPRLPSVLTLHDLSPWMNAGWQSNDYTYTEAGTPSQASLTAPAPGSNSSSAVPPSWISLLFSHLLRYRQYPNSAQSSHQEGVVMLSFTMDRNGHVLSRHIARSSGVAALDTEALAMIERAQPLPAFPPSMPEASRSFTAPIKFTLR